MALGALPEAAGAGGVAVCAGGDATGGVEVTGGFDVSVSVDSC